MNASFLNASQKIKDTTPLAGDAGNRSYARVQFEGVDKNFILCDYPEKDFEQLENFMDVYKLFTTYDINIPVVIESSKNQMLLEDLGDTSLEDFFKSGGKPYSQAIEQLVKMQSIPKKGKSKAQSFSFTVEKFVWEMNFTLTHFSKLLEIKLSPDEITELQKEFTELCTHLCSLEQVITHRDYHSRNLMVQNDKTYVIDFQDARIGPKFYDLVSIVEDSYTELNDKTKTALIENYCKETQVALDETFMTNYHLQNLQRSFKACGSFASFKTRTDNNRYLKYLKPAFKSLFTSCGYIPEYPNLKSFIKVSSEKWNEYDG